MSLRDSLDRSSERIDARSNKPGLTDPQELQDYERLATAARYLELVRDPLAAGPVTLDYDYLQRVHAHSLQDVYRWAGATRTIPTMVCGAYRDDGSPLEHIPPEQVPGALRDAFAEISDLTPDAEDLDAAADLIGSHYAALTEIHPFADGNSRAQRHFFTEYAAAHGIGLDWARIDADLLHAARMTAHATGNHGYLAAALRPGLRPLAELDREGALDAAYRHLGDKTGNHPEFFTEMMENERLGALSPQKFVQVHSRTAPRPLTWIERRRARERSAEKAKRPSAAEQVDLLVAETTGSDPDRQALGPAP